MDLDQALQTFISESFELLDDMEASLLSLSEQAGSPRDEAINAIFRAAHTIKGSAGLFGLDHVVAFTHVAESVLDEVRAGRVAVSESLVSLLLSCCDHMRSLTQAIAEGRVAPDASLQAQAGPLLAALSVHLPGAERHEPTPVNGATPVAAVPACVGCWQLSVRFGPGVLRNGLDPMSFIRYLSTIGEIRRIETLADALPPAEDMDPECCYLGFEIALETSADQAAIESVFEFVADDCTLNIVPPGIRAEPPAAAEIAAPAAATAASAAIPDAQHPPDKQDTPDKTAANRKPRDNQSVRVDSDKLDRLIDLVGELIIAQAGAGLVSRRTADLELRQAHKTLASLVQQVRDSALQLRTVKIGPTFQRFQRVVRDTARELGKEIALVIKGEDTELDKTVIENIGDPLTHLVRNAIDHGIGLPEIRIQRGKPVCGTITLNAYHDAGQVVIEVSDDGHGLSRERILNKAIERGLVEADRVLTDREVHNLIFEPGFSTAEQVTNLSGRGVGMDVVKRNITAMRGTVDVISQEKVGTTVIVRLPLTLAIIDGFQVGIGKSVFVVPLDMVDECIEYRSADAVGVDNDCIDLRGQVLPLIRLRSVFSIGGAAAARQNIVVVRCAGRRVGLVVDTLLGEAQTVIKPLCKMFGHLKGISGSSIRGSGDVVLILDVPALISQATQSGAQPATALGAIAS